MVITRNLKLRTRGEGDIIDITPQVARAIAEEKVSSGIVNVFVAGSTAAVTTIEYESGLLQDMGNLWEKLAPKNQEYHHNLRWGDNNGHAHLRASLLGPSLVIPFSSQTLHLGTWQQIVLVDFDNRPRSREIILQIMGE